MLTQKQVIQIKEHLEKAQNPIFFFDNDLDGLCSFLLLRRYCLKGKGVAVRTFPTLDAGYFRKINELNADYIFILDKPLVSPEFLTQTRERNVPVVWIDHHVIDKNQVPDFVDYYNSALDKKENEPTTFLCYQVSKKPEDLWIAVMGCIADGFLPDFYNKFEESYPDLSTKAKKAFDVLYNSGLGKISKILGNGLKDKTSNVVAMLKFLIGVKNPYEILEENSKNYLMHKRSAEIERKYQSLLLKAEKLANKSKKILFFKYSGELSISAELANELCYRYNEKIIVVAYVKGGKVNLSVRGEKVRTLVIKAVEGLEGATAGGHENAVGAQMKSEDLEKFEKKLEETI